MFDVLGANTVVVRTAGEPGALATAVRDAVRSLDKNLAIYEVQTMAQRQDAFIAARRFNLLLLGGFAIAAAVLASAGVYSVVAYIMSQRKQEIGIGSRLAQGK
jgi:putative ABC transport system permease protein